MKSKSAVKFLITCAVGLLLGFGVATLLTLWSMDLRLMLFFLGAGIIYALVERLLVHRPIKMWPHRRRHKSNGLNRADEPITPEPVLSSPWQHCAGFWVCFALPVIASLPNFVLSFGEAP